jgi:cation diffusion facilitator CzcD-associated flavoprotein CzcO
MWLVELEDLSTRQTYHRVCKILISAVGALVNPNPFNVRGADLFQGSIVHTARWTPFEMRNKNIIVVGNGCKSSMQTCGLILADSNTASATQLIPAIVDQVSTITQFIRVSDL